MDCLAFKHNERLSDVINKLKSQLTPEDNAHLTRNLSESETNMNPTKEIETLNREDGTEQLKLPDNESSTGWRSLEDKSLSKSYLMWENNANLCWLDSSMSLLVHNKSLAHLVANVKSSQISKILQGYENAISVFNDYTNESSVEERLQKAKDMLQKVQEIVLDYLKPILKCKEGEPDSAFCSLLNLISENKLIKNLFLVEFSWIRNCTKCVVPRVKNNKKTIVTLSKVKEFNPSSPVSLYKCPFCESPDQKMEIKYKTLPECLIFHFENGAGEGELDSLDFELNDRKYKLSGLITLEKSRDLSVNHFVTWVRDIATDSWLECNDLNSDILSFGVVPPLINLKDLYIVMYEALDEKGTISNISGDTDYAIGMDADDTNSSDIPVIDLSDEEEGTELKQANGTNKREPDPMFLGGLFKHDETDYDSDEKLSKRLDEILSDSIFSPKNTLESSETNALEYFDSSCSKENNTTSTKEKISAENSELENLNLQDNASSTSSEKTDDVLLRMKSNSLTTDSESDCKNGAKICAAVNIKQSLVKDSIKMPMKDGNEPFISSNSEMASFVKPVLDNTVNTSKEINGKPLNGTSSIEKLPMLTNKKDIISGKRNIPSGLAKSIPGKDHTVSLTRYPSAAFNIKDGNKNADCPRKSPIEPQNSTDVNLLVQINNLNMNSPINAIGDCAQDTGESCARTSGLPISHKEWKKKIALKTDIAFKKIKTIENEKCTKVAAVGYMDNPLIGHGAEKTVETSTSPDLNLHTSDTQKQLQKSGIHLSTFPENVAAITIKNTNDTLVLEGKSIVISETKIQNINTTLPVESHILSRKAFEDSSSEINKEPEFTTIKHNHISNNLLATLNPTNEKSTVNFFEDKVHTNISRDVVAKHADISVEEVFVEDNTNFIIKQSKVNAKSLEDAVPKESENINPISSMHQTRILNHKAEEQPEAALASSVKPNEQLNVQSVENQEITEDDSSEKTVKQQMREFEEKHPIFSEYQLGVKNLKMPFVQLPRLKDSEIAYYASGKVTFAEPKQSKSLEELTKTVVVKVEQTDPKSILKRADETAGPSRTTKVEKVESVRGSSRIFARRMKEAERAKKSSPKIISKKNPNVQPANSISTNKALPEVAKKTSKMLELPKRAYRTRSAPVIRLDVSNDDHSQRNTKKKRSEDSHADEGVKSKRRRNKSVEVGYSAIQSHLPTTLETNSSSQIVQGESDVSLKALGSSPSKNDPVTGREIAIYTGNHIQPNNSVHELQAKEECASDCECNDLQLHELIENSSNFVFANVFQFFNLHY